MDHLSFLRCDSNIHNCVCSCRLCLCCCYSFASSPSFFFGYYCCCFFSSASPPSVYNRILIVNIVSQDHKLFCHSYYIIYRVPKNRISIQSFLVRLVENFSKPTQPTLNALFHCYWCSSLLFWWFNPPYCPSVILHVKKTQQKKNATARYVLWMKSTNQKYPHKNTKFCNGATFLNIKSGS